MNEKILHSLKKENHEQFNQRLSKLSKNDLIQTLTSDFFVDNDIQDFNCLTYIIQTYDSLEDKKAFVLLEKINEIKSFNLEEYINKYSIKNGMYKTTPLYLLCIFFNKPEIMEKLYEYGANPYIEMTRHDGAKLNGDMICNLMNSSKEIKELHTLLKAYYLSNQLNNTLINNDKTEKKMKI